MNNDRRKRIGEAVKLLEESTAKYQQAYEILEDCKDEEEEAFENLPEGLQSAERGETMQENIESLESALEELTNLNLT